MSPVNVKQRVEVCLGSAGRPVGRLTYVKQGARENSTFAYDPSWLDAADRFDISPDLPLHAGFQARKAPSKHDSVFQFAFADSAPDAWGRRVIARAHAKQRKRSPEIGALTELDYLLAVDDFSRVGALRLRNEQGEFLQSVEQGRRATPPLVDLAHLYEASRAVEKGTESQEDLRYLLGRGTSLGGMRPKCTLVDADGRLAIGKFPSIADERSVTRGEVLALHLARAAGLNVATARLHLIGDTPVALIERFDRTLEGGRRHYLSAASMLQASREEDRSYMELVDVIVSRCADPKADLTELWRRLVFNLLVTNVDDHLQNHAFLREEHGLYELSPAFDINPFPDKDRESKTLLSEADGPIVSVEMLLGRADHFRLDRAAALSILGTVVEAVQGWRETAVQPAIGLRPADLDSFAPAFEHDQMDAAIQALR